MKSKELKKRVLFYLIHPAKFNQCRITINNLISKGHEVEIVIIGRDILEELVKKEGWKYKMIFPKGRKMKGVHIYISSGLLFFPTIWKLFKLTWGKKYDLFISDDLISYVGRLRGIPTIYLVDDDLNAVPHNILYILPAKHIFAPSICGMGNYENKKLGYYGYKALTHLHPNIFRPNRDKIDSSLPPDKPFFYIRTVLPTSKHDVGKSGIGDELLGKIIRKLESEGNIILNSEREVADEFKKYRLDYNKNDVSHYLYFAKMVIGDSTTMSVEAAVLGTPSIEIDDWFADFKQYEELHGKYKILDGFHLDEEVAIFDKIDEYLSMEDLEGEFEKRRQRMLEDKIDVSSFLTWIIEEYPESTKEFYANRNMQKRFKY